MILSANGRIYESDNNIPLALISEEQAKMEVRTARSKKKPRRLWADRTCKEWLEWRECDFKHLEQRKDEKKVEEIRDSWN